MNDEYDVTTETMRDDLADLVLADSDYTNTEADRAKDLANKAIKRGFRRHFDIFDESEVEDLPDGSILIDEFGRTLTALQTWVKGLGFRRRWQGVGDMMFEDAEVALPAHVVLVDDGLGPWMRIDLVPDKTWVEGRDGAIFYTEWPDNGDFRRLAHWVDGELRDLQGGRDTDDWWTAWANANQHRPFRARTAP